MSSNNNPLRALDIIEEDLVESLAAAGQALKELSKDKPNVRATETLYNTFMGRLDKAGAELSHQIAYLSRVTTSSAAEGLSYGSKIDVQMAKNRLNHAQSYIRQLEAASKK